MTTPFLRDTASPMPTAGAEPLEPELTTFPDPRNLFPGCSSALIVLEGDAEEVADLVVGASFVIKVVAGVGVAASAEGTTALSWRAVR
jgi:hypothetical protein